MEKTSSLIYSASLHFLLLFLILFWPVNTILDIEKNSYQVSLVTGKAGESVPVRRTTRPQPIPQKTQEAKPEVPVEKNAAPVEIPKEEAKPVVKEEAKKQESSKEESQSQPESSAALSALAELEQMLQADSQSDANTMPASGNGEDEEAENVGGGIYEVYISTIMLAVRNEWRMPIYDRENYIAEVYVELDAQGNIVDKHLERSSGRADFDGSALNALERLGKLPAPPSPELQNLVLVFNSAQ